MAEGQWIIHFCMGKGMKITSQGQVFSYSRQSHQELGE
jgi:hypothetical protein